ncbi:YDG domain-containing protein [Sphingobium sp. B12D2B]|uniref:YDG domain-containing protein n=1 Tax=Sphingobium sp. B12D2B TaxID=2940577 RepID=UPI002224D37F|nr:YDG domain-containing protein [Sphingobium sp. B12D2B]MCW2351806.1 filamentous hemagglutinin family protein [Sphingobium sp. B12D2B]
MFESLASAAQKSHARCSTMRHGASGLALMAALSLALPVKANPAGGVVVAGDAVIAGQGTGSVTINQSSGRAILDWQSFSVGTGENVRFVQPGKDAIAVNRVTGADASQILGNLSANGQLVLINRNGIAFGKSAVVDVAGLVATTADIDAEGFMATGALSFSNGARVPGAGIVNEGRITVRDAGLAALVAPSVRNSGVIVADMGRVALGAGTGFVVDLYGDGMIKFAPDGAIQQTLGDGSGALVDNSGTVQANGGRVLLTASAAREVVNASVNSTGIIRAEGIKAKGGTISLTGSGHIASTGLVSADSAQGQGGQIAISGGSVALGGLVTASGKTGGNVAVTSENLLSLADAVQAVGTLGTGGNVTYMATRVIETDSGFTNVSGLTHGGKIKAVAATDYTSSGSYLARGSYGRGGRIDLTGEDTVSLLGATLSAGGQAQGGLIRIGGAFQGGKTPDQAQPYYRTFLGRWGNDLGELAHAGTLFVGDGTVIDVSSKLGEGGTAVLWSDKQTTSLGAIDARGALPGSVEISSAGELRKLDIDHVETGPGGYLLLDPKNITIGSVAQASTWAYSALLRGISGPILSSVPLAQFDHFGYAVALNGAGDRLAVGLPGVEGQGTGFNATGGAVYLFSFTDTNFNGAKFEAAISKNITGGKNIVLNNLEANDLFGSAVAFNSSGDRLAVGAARDEGFGNAYSDAGAVYLFAFQDNNFNNGYLAQLIGKGYTGVNQFSPANLGTGDNFGRGVSLNGTGDRLVVGAPYDDGFNNNFVDGGAVYGFGFNGTEFANPTVMWMAGRDYGAGSGAPAGLHVSNLETSNLFGSAVSMTPDGTKLAIGSPNDRGAGKDRDEAGGAYLLSFTSKDFTSTEIRKIIGAAYYGGSEYVSFQPVDHMGESVALSADGTKFAIGGTGAAPAGFTNTGQVQVFSLWNNMGSYAGPKFYVGRYSSPLAPNVVYISNDTGDEIGASLAFNADGTRLAVGSRGDDGFANDALSSGAVYLIGFNSDLTSRSLIGTMGRLYTGGNNVNVARDTSLRTSEFGASLALNGAGTLIAIGAPGDSGASGSKTASGAVYLFATSSASFSSAVLYGIAGSGYAGGKNVDVSFLDASDRFGASVALNASGNRMAVGATGDAGLSNVVGAGTGAVYLFNFSDNAFASGYVTARVGGGYNATGDVNINNLGVGDNFGASVSLNSAGTGLVVGAPGDDGSGNSASNNGAVYLLSFSDGSFNGGTWRGTVGRGYGGANDYNLSALSNGSALGTGAALNGAGDRLAIGATAGAGAVYLFTFSDTSYNTPNFTAVIGSGATGGKNIDMSARLGAGDLFGASLSLNAAGNMLAVGAPGDDGIANGSVDNGAVYLFNFADGSFTGGVHNSTFGQGYTGTYDYNQVVAGGQFGRGVALNAAGDRLAVGAPQTDPNGNSQYVGGAAILFQANAAAGTAYGDDPSGSVTLSAYDIASRLATGTSVILQANNDITVNSAITVTGNPSSVGALTLQAGRSVLINANITTQGGNVNVYAHDTAANGVQSAQRDTGTAGITMAAGTAINAGGGNVSFEMRTGAGKGSQGYINLASITASNITVYNSGGTGTGITLLNNSVLTGTSGGGAALQIAGDLFANQSGLGNGALATPNGGRWLIWTSNPANDTLNGLNYAFKQYNATYGSSPVQGTGNGVLYKLSPTLNISLKNITKQYDGGTTATVTSSDFLVTGVIAGDTLTVSAQNAAFTGKGAGSGNKTVTANTLTATAVEGAKPVYGYVLPNPTSVSNSTSTITPKALTINVTAQNKIYDGGLVAALNTATLNNVVVGDVVSATGGTGAFLTKTAGGGKSVTVSGFTLSGADAANYTVTQPTGVTATISQRALTVNVTAQNKIYDGGLGATLNAATLSNVVSGDTVTATGGTGAFLTKTAGGGKSVTVSGFTLSGADAANYTVTQPTGVTATISQRALTVNVTAQNKIYDGGLGATLNAATLSNVVSGDTVTVGGGTGAFATKTAETGKAVTVSGYSLSGADAANYTVTQPTGLTADISQRALTISVSAQDKDYDGQLGATLNAATLNNAISGDDISVGGGTGVFLTKTAEAGKAVLVSGYMLSGVDSANYTVTQPTGVTATINQRALTINVTAQNKIYDGQLTAALNGATLNNVISGDTVLVGGGTGAFTTKTAENGKVVVISGFTLSGADATNYTVVQPTGVTADITKRSLTVDLKDIVGKTYDANDVANIGAANWDTNELSGDVVSVTGGNAYYSDKNAGTGKLVTASNYTLAGADALNYDIANSSVSRNVGSISPRGLNLSITADDKVYDGNDSATIHVDPLTGVFAGDAVSLVVGQGHFGNKNVQTNKGVTFSGFSLTGTDALNYEFNAFPVVTADITSRQLTVIDAAAVDRTYDGTATVQLDGILDNIVAGDDVAFLSKLGTMADKNAGTGKAVTTAFSITGADKDNYTLVQPTGVQVDIAKALLTLVTPQATDRAYDGTNIVEVTHSGFSGTIGSDDIGIASVNGTIASRNVGTYEVTMVLGALTGADAGNYLVATPSPLLMVTIDQKTITGSLTGVITKEYDGTRDINLAPSNYVLTGVEAGDNVTLAGDGAYDDKNVGSNIRVEVNNTRLEGGDAGNYKLLASAAVEGQGAITKRQITVLGATALDRDYDGTTVVALTGTLDRVVTGEDVGFQSTTGTIGSKNVGTYAVTTGFTLSGADIGNYDLIQPADPISVTISAAKLTLAGTAVNAKTYDATTTVTYANSGTLTGVVAGEDVSIGTISGTAVKNAGTQNVTTTVLLAGADSANYEVIDPNLTVLINKASLDGKLVNVTKTYDGTTGVTLGVANYALDGVIGSDAVSLVGSGTGAYAGKDAGSNILVSSAVTGLSGADADNYELSSMTVTSNSGEITKALLHVTDSAGIGRDYNGLTTVNLSGALDGVVAGETVTLTGTGTAASKNVGTWAVSGGTYTLGGADMINYDIEQPTDPISVTISAAKLILTGTAVNDKTYDGSTAVTFGNLGTLNGVVSGEDVAIGSIAGNATSKNAGVQEVATSVSLSGADMANYEVINPSLTVTIGKKTISGLLTGQVTKVYDGTTAIVLSPSNYQLAGVLAGDAVTLSGSGSYADKNVGDNKSVVVSETRLSGADAGNYVLSSSSSVSGNIGRITPAALALFVDDKTRLVGGADPVFSYRLQGLVEGDSADVVTGVTFASAGAGSAPIGQYTINASNGSAQNYTISYTPGTLFVTADPSNPNPAGPGTPGWAGGPDDPRTTVPGRTEIDKVVHTTPNPGNGFTGGGINGGGFGGGSSLGGGGLASGQPGLGSDRIGNGFGGNPYRDIAAMEPTLALRTSADGGAPITGEPLDEWRRRLRFRHITPAIKMPTTAIYYVGSQL